MVGLLQRLDCTDLVLCHAGVANPIRDFDTQAVSPVVWVMVPYLYLPYSIWQLYEGLTLLSPEPELIWVRNLLIIEVVLWTLNYALDLSQLPRLLRWEVQENTDTFSE